MTTNESADKQELVITDVAEAEVVFRAGRYSLGSWLKGEEAAQRSIDVANRIKNWIAASRNGTAAAELTFLGGEADLVLDNLWAAYADATNSRRPEAASVLESLYDGPVTVMALGRTALLAVPPPETIPRAG